MENEFEVSKEEMNPSEHQHPVQPSHHGKKHAAVKRKKLMIIVSATVAGLLLVASALWFFVLRKPDPKPVAQTPGNTNQTNPSEELPAPTPTDSTPVAYKSAKLNLELTHRKDWTLTENTEGTELVLTSPRTTYTRVDGTAGTGVFTVKIRQGATEAMKATIEKSVAARDSEVIGYAAPTESQRHYTNVSYAGAGKGETFNFFIVTGSTELKAGKPFAYMLAFDNDAYLFVGGYGEDKDGSLSFDAVPKTAIDSTSKEQAIDIIESIKLF